MHCSLKTLPALLLVPVALALGGRAARAEHDKIDLKVTSPDDESEAFADREPPTGGYNQRPIFTVKAGDPLVLQFLLTDAYPHGVTKDVTIRYFVVRTDQIGQKELPAFSQDSVVTQGHAVLNMKPDSRVGARFNFRVNNPGTYLVRIDTVNTQSDHEHFSAIDLEVR